MPLPSALRDHPRRTAVAATVAGGLLFFGGYSAVACTCPLPVFPSTTTSAGTTTAPTTTTTTTTPLASVFVSVTGADANSCDSVANACATFDRACQVAAPDSVVAVESGTYTSGFSLTTSCTAGTAGHPVTFKPDVDAAVLLDGTMRIAASHVVLRDFVWCCQTNDAKDQGEVWTIPAGDDIQMINLDSSGMSIFPSSNVTVSGGDVGPCIRGDKGQPVNTIISATCEPQVFGTTTNTLIKGVTFHEQSSSGVLGQCGTVGDKCHVAGFVCWGCEGVTLDSNKFYGNEVNNFFGQNCCGWGDISDVTLVNNWFGPVAFNVISPESDGCLALSSSGTIWTRLYVLFNSFNCTNNIIWSSSGSTYPSLRLIGNLMFLDDAFFCPPSAGTQDYNDFVGNSSGDHCGTNFGVITSGTPWLNTSGTSAMNLHLGGSFTGTSPDNYVPTSVTGGCPAKDYDGQNRPLNTNCDAGADERTP